MALFSKKKEEPDAARETAPSAFAMWVSGDGTLPSGYHRLLDSPEVATCIHRIASIISSTTIYLMENTAKGDKRRKDGLSRLVDIDPWPNVLTRQMWMNWIVTELIGDGDGNACVLPMPDPVNPGRIARLMPMPGASIMSETNGCGYHVEWRGRRYEADEILHFRLFPDSQEPWRGRGFKTAAQNVARALKTTDELKVSLSSPDYRPPIIISVDSDADLSDETKREAWIDAYISDPERKGLPWVLPAGLAKVDTVRPLSLSDLAVKDTVELDKKTVAAIFGVPPFLLGIGQYSGAEFNNFIKTVVEPICVGIEQELTLKLLFSENLFFSFNRRRLYAYSMSDLVDMDLKAADRGYINGDEVREDMYRDPAGLTEFKVLENYIPYEDSGNQKKLSNTDEGGDSDA